MTENARKQQTTRVGLLLFCTDRMRTLATDDAGVGYEAIASEYGLSILDALKDMCAWVYPGNVYGRSDLERAMRMFVTEDVDAVLAVHISWTEDFNWIRFLRDMPPMPVMLACVTRESMGFERVTMDSSFTRAMASCNVVGALEASGNIERVGRSMVSTCAGTLGELTGRLEAWTRAAGVRARLRRANFGLLGDYNEVMWSTYVDPYDVFARIGPELRFCGIPDLLREVDAVGEGEVEQASLDALSRYASTMPIDPKKLRASIRASMAFERLSVRKNLDALVYNDVDAAMLRSLGLRPGFLRMDDGNAVTVPEGDLGSGVAAYVLHELSGGPIQYIEPFYIVREQDWLVVGHSGPSNYAEDPARCLLCNDMRFAAADIRYPAAPMAWYAFPEGRYTLLHFSQGRNRLKMVMSRADILPSDHFLRVVSPRTASARGHGMRGICRKTA